jgi:hypothetical protein
MSVASERARLSAEQRAQYQRDGYTLYKQPVLAPERFAALTRRFEQILAALPGEDRPEAMDVPHFLYPDLLSWAFDDAILDLVAPILGPDLALFSTHFICKPAGHGKRVPWHEDSAYWKGKLEPLDVCTVWLAIDPSRRTNGCMKVIPRTHATGHKGYSDYAPVDTATNVFDAEILPTQRDDSQAVYLELAPNECSLHDARIIHGSDANTSTLRRCGWTLRFMPTTCQLSREFGQYQKIYLARGQDHAGNAYGDPTRAYPDIARMRATKIKHSH